MLAAHEDDPHDELRRCAQAEPLREDASSCEESGSATEESGNATKETESDLTGRYRTRTYDLAGVIRSRPVVWKLTAIQVLYLGSRAPDTADAHGQSMTYKRKSRVIQ